MSRLQNGLIRYSKKGFILFFAFILISCNNSRNLSNSSNGPVLPYKVDGASDRHAMEMKKQIERHGIRVITLGQDYLVSIPSDVLFANQSPRLTWASFDALNDVACYLKQFRKISVNVTAFSSKCISPQRERALTLARARNVANYLWSQNVDARFIFTHGSGSDKPIMAYTAGGDSSTNSRVEITFRDAVA